MHDMLSHVVKMSWHAPFLRHHKLFFQAFKWAFSDTKKTVSCKFSREKLLDEQVATEEHRMCRMHWNAAIEYAYT